MSNRTLLCGVATCTLLAIGRVAWAQVPAPAPAPTPANAQAQANAQQSASANQVTVPFSDPSRAGTVKVSVLSGSITVRVGTGREVVVSSTPRERDADDDRDRERERNRSGRSGAADDPAAGLKRLTQPAGVNIQEENNVISVSAPVMNGPVNLDIQVPAATSLVLRAVNGGQVSVVGVNGSIEVNNVNGSIRLADVGGAVIAHATNGRVVATLRQIAEGKPMSFTSFNGDVDVTLPGSAKANLKLRSDRGDVYTDFEVQTTLAAARPPASDPRPDNKSRDDDRGRSRDDTRGNAKYRLEIDRSIYGSINGGGPDFELRTFNGNIYLRKAK